MRHSKVVNHLGRTSSHRKAMLANMATSLIIHKRINTTTAKAKALRTYVEPLITKSKDDSTHSRRIVFSYLQDKKAVTELFREVAPKVGERPGGYTRILKTGSRIGDNADMCIIELVDYNEGMLAAGETAKAKTRRRRAPKKKAETAVAEAAPKAPKTSKAKTVEKAPEIVAETTVETVPEVNETVEAVVETNEENPEIVDEPIAEESFSEEEK